MFVSNEKRFIYYEMAKPNSKEQKKYAFKKKKCLVGSTPYVIRLTSLIGDSSMSLGASADRIP